MSQQYSYRLRMNRNATRKWAEARRVDYGGDDWGADPYAEEQVEPSPPLSHSGRSFTNPAYINTNHRLSFDHGPEQRVFSATDADPHPAVASTDQPSQSAFPRDQFQSHIPDQLGRTSLDALDYNDPTRINRAPVTASGAFPPGKSSLSQSNVPDFSVASQEQQWPQRQQQQQQQQQQQPQPQQLPSAESQPPVFIRPADIYKRVEEEREKERRSQESPRPSLESVQKDQSESTPKHTIDESPRRLRSNLDTVAERQSEYGMEGLTAAQPAYQPDPHRNSPSQIDTDIAQVRSIPSASSRYTDRPESIATDSHFPSRNVSQHESTVTARPSFLPQVSRTSTFGTDFFRTTGPTGEGGASPRQPEQSYRQPVDEPLSGPKSGTTGPYRTMVDSAFRAENNATSSPARTDDSLLRSNTTSTSQISPIVGRSKEPEWDSILTRDTSRDNNYGNENSVEEMVEDLGAPRRVGTNRRDSPSPARRPLSIAAPPVPEPQSAIISPGDTAKEAQFTRPGPAVLVHQKGMSCDSTSKVEPVSATSASGATPTLREQGSQQSEVSDDSNLRTASDEWRDWSKSRKEFNAKHGFKDSNPTTPGLEPSGVSPPAPPFNSLDQNVSMSADQIPDDTDKPLSGVASLPPSIRPQMTRDESFRPQLPGGWESSASIQKATTPSDSVDVDQPRPSLSTTGTRTESAESIPTAGAPREADWRSQYTGPQAQAFAAAAAAGSALAGIFSGSALTSRTDDSEVSSINERDENPTGHNRDPSLATRDFASSTPPPPAVPDQYATRDFASTTSTPHEDSQNTPKAPQHPFTPPSGTSHPKIKRPSMDSRRAESPSKESERWWSDEEDAHAPAPLRTNRLGSIDPGERRSPAIPHPSRREDDSPDPEQLESDIVKSLTPKSSSIHQYDPVSSGYGLRLSPTRTNENRAGSPPFAAAALAVSPARDYNALREQNTFQPLSSPESASRHPLSRSAASDVFSSESPAESSAQPRSQAMSTSAPWTESGKNGQTRGENTTPVRSGTKEFSILPDMPASLAVAPVSARGYQDDHSTQPSLVDHPTKASDESERARTSIENRRLAPGTGQYSTAHEAVTVSGPGSNMSTPTKTVTIGGPVKQPTITTPRAVSPVSISQGSNSAHSPVMPVSGKANQSNIYDPNRSFPVDKIPVEQIFGMGSAQQRIQAYHDNRDAYAEPVGHVENWLSHMNTAEHADAFTATPRTKVEHATPTSRHRREDSTPIGTKHMQEDGKRLLASASKYGAKAGVLGKGLFSKGKEKLRTVSASQKAGSAIRKVSRPPGVDKSRSASNSPVPQLPTPTMGTPVDDSSFSAYFPSRDAGIAPETGAKAAAAPPFSPISEVSSNQMDLGRSVSAVSEEQSPQSNTTARRTDPTVSAAPESTPHTDDDDRRKSAGAVSALESERDGRRVSTDLNPTGAEHGRCNSSVSDVSSVSDASHHRRNPATRTVSPPIEHQISRAEAPSLPPPPVPQVSNVPAESQRAHHAPSYSTAMASKEAEALQDRADEQTLPAYSQPTLPKPSRIPPGAPVVPIARLRQDQEVRAEEPRPFSFVGSESLLHTGHTASHSIDNPGVNIGSSTPDAPTRNAGDGLAQAAAPGANVQPLPAPSKDSNGRSDATKPSRILTQAQAEEQYRIPGPYGHELRSPRPKTSSPMLEQFRTPIAPQTAQPTADAAEDGPTSQPAVTAEYTPFPTRQTVPQQTASQQMPPQPAQPQPALPQPTQQFQQQQPASRTHTFGPDPPYTQPIRPDGGSTFQEARDRERSRDRSRPSKFSALFRSRSRSRSRRLQKEKTRQPEARPGNHRRNSLFKLGGRNGSSRGSSYDQGQSQGHDEITDQPIQNNSRSAAGSRRLSLDLLKGATFGHTGKGQESSSQQAPVSSNKKKRFSGFFGRSTGKNEPGQSENANQRSGPPSQGGHVRSQAALAPDREEGAWQENGAYRQYPTGQSQPAPSQSVPEEDARPFGPQPVRVDSYGSPFPDHQAHRNEQADQYSLYSHVSYRKPLQPGSPYQHENQPNPYAQTHHSHFEQPRPVLPRLDTGDNRSSNTTPVPASAPPVPGSYMQARQSQKPVSVQTHTLPQDASSQQYHQLSFPQPQSLSQYHPPPTTRAARDISHNSDSHDWRMSPLPSSSSANNDQNNRQFTSPLPVAQPDFSIPSRAPGPMFPPPSRITPRVAQLHIRSRSPKLGRRSSDDLNQEFDTATAALAINAPHSASSMSPVATLGTFTSKKVSPIGGIPRSSEEQEKPWALSLPADEEERKRKDADPDSATSSRAREMKRILLERSPITSPVTTTTTSTQSPTLQTVADRFMLHGMPPTQPRTFDHQPPLHGTTKTAQGSRTNTPTNGRPTTPSVTLRRDASLRGKEPQGRTSNIIDEAGQVPTVGGSLPRKDTPISAPGPSSARNSPDVVNNQNAVAGDPSQRDTAATPATSTAPPIPGAASALSSPLPGQTVNSSAQTPKNEHAVVPVVSPLHGEPAVEGSVPIVAPVAAAAAAASPPTESSPTSKKAKAGTTDNTKPKSPRAEKADEVYEMAGSKPEDYESEEEPVMSATAYPGQEWQPVFERWED